MSRWEIWGDILEVLEEAGEKRFDPNPTQITTILDTLKTRRTLDQIKIELFRILEGMTSGEAQSAIVQGTTRNVLDVFRRLISKGKSRTKAAVRELRQKRNLPRKAKHVNDYDAAVAEWDSNVATLIAYRGSDTLPAQEDLLEAYYSILPAEVMTFAQIKIDESFEPEGFREEMEKYIYRQIRENKTTKTSLANIIKECHERFTGLNNDSEEKEETNKSEEDQVQNLVNLLKGKGKGKGKSEKGPNGGKGLCFNCGEAGHYAANSPKTKREGGAKGGTKGKGKSSKGMNSFAEVFKAAGLEMPIKQASDESAGGVHSLRPMRRITKPYATAPECSTRQECCADYSMNFQEKEDWKKPKRPIKRPAMKKDGSRGIKTTQLFAFLQMRDFDEAGDDDKSNSNDKISTSSPPSTNDEVQLSRNTLGRYTPITKKDKMSVSTSDNEPNTRKNERGSAKKHVGCLSKCQLDHLSCEDTTDIDQKIENMKVLTDQLKKSICQVKHNEEDKSGWHRVSLTVDPGACDTVADPRSLPGYELKETAASKAGEFFLTAGGDPIPQLGEKEVVICTENGDLKSLKAQCSAVAKPFLSVKRMTEAGQFVGFSRDGGFVFDLATGNVDWFREGNGNYILDVWLVPHNKVDEVVEAYNSQSFTRLSN